MPEEIKNEEVQEEVKKEEEVEESNDKGGEDKEEKIEGEEKEESFDETSLIDKEVLEYKPTAPVEEEDEDTDPEDRARIEKIVEKKYGGPIEEVKKRLEFDTFFNANPEMAKYRHAVEIYKSHPDYSRVPVSNLANMVSAKDAEKRGAAKERAAARIVEETKNPGSSVRKPAGQANDWLSAPKDDFEAKKSQVLGRLGN